MTTTFGRKNKLNESDRIARIYHRLAKFYDFLGEKMLCLIFCPFGYRSYRKRAIAELKLQSGDTVVDLCCGTGLNFPLLEKAIGANGKIIGVDLSNAMLKQARKRLEVNHWTNIDLIQSDAAYYSFPARVDGILSTWAITLVPKYDQVILNGSQALMPGKTWVILDFKILSNWLSGFAPLMSLLFIRPFGGNLKMADRHPWEIIH